jgi:hypothetical protein
VIAREYLFVRFISCEVLYVIFVYCSSIFMSISCSVIHFSPFLPNKMYVAEHSIILFTKSVCCSNHFVTCKWSWDGCWIRRSRMIIESVCFLFILLLVCVLNFVILITVVVSIVTYLPFCSCLHISTTVNILSSALCCLFVQ